MSDPFNRQNYTDLRPDNPERHHLCTKVWRLLLLIGAALTFIRNFICNAVMLLLMLFIFIGYQAATSFKEEAEMVITGGQPLPAQTKTAKILYLPLSGTISEIPFAGSQFEMLYRQLNDSLAGRQSHDLTAIEAALEEAAEDPQIEYVLVNLEGLRPLSMTAAARIGAKLKAVTDAGKQTAAMAVNYSQAAYLIAVNAGSVYLDPLGSVGLRGIALSSLYYRSLLDKLNVTPYVFRAGHFKSAVEPFLQDGMSADVKAEYQQLADGLWSIYTQELHARKALSRTVILPEASAYINSLNLYHGDEALMQLEQNLADELIGSETLFARLSKEYGADEESFNLPNMIDYRDYLRTRPEPELPADKIAVVYGVGNITDTSQDPTAFSADNLCAILDEVGRDQTIRAMVLYLNSPGGMASASEKIRRSLEQLRASGLKVVVAIQGLGASGAYWTATASDKIVAAPESLVGSIGVFSVSLGLHQLLNGLGVYQDGVYTHEFSRPAVAERLGPNTERYYELSVQHTYRTFIDLVAASRHLSPDNYLSYAEGQVFLAGQAQQLGLVDELGSLDDALEEAAKLAGGKLDDFTILETSLPRDARLNAIESIIFSVSAKLLPENITKALMDLKFADKTDSAPLKEQILLQSALQEPLL